SRVRSIQTILDTGKREPNIVRMVEATTLALGLLVTFELGYFVKAIIYTVGSRFLRSKVHPLAKTHVWGICSTRDIDFMLNHINNARYLRAMDFGRLDHFTRSRFSSVLMLLWRQTQIAPNNLHKFVRDAQWSLRVKICIPIVYWDSRNFYYRQDFHTIHDNFLRVTAYVKVAVQGATPTELFQASKDMFGLANLPQKTGDEHPASSEVEISDIIDSPPLPNDLAAWINFNNESSAVLKKSREHKPQF
ncbi:unnamed protein product, partial [Meganyctiphanes norvegica]